MTHWAGQYVPQECWPTVCGPDGTPIRRSPTPGKDCNVFDGDYTGLAVDSDRVHVTGPAQPHVVSTQLDPYTGGLHDGYAQDAMFARR